MFKTNTATNKAFSSKAGPLLPDSVCQSSTMEKERNPAVTSSVNSRAFFKCELQSHLLSPFAICASYFASYRPDSQYKKNISKELYLLWFKQKKTTFAVGGVDAYKAA